MHVNLNNPEEITLEHVREFIRSGDDSVHNQIKVTEGGIAYFSQDYGKNYEGHRFYLETYVPHNSYVGEGAANDDNWVKEVHDTLQDAWHNDRRGFTDY